MGQEKEVKEHINFQLKLVSNENCNQRFRRKLIILMFAKILLCLTITCRIWNSNHHQLLCFSFPSIIIILNICACMSAINRPWKTETYIMDRNPSITVKNMTFWPRRTQFIHFQRLPLHCLTATENATVGGDLNFGFHVYIEKCNN